MLRVGLTGGIATGKSYVARRLRSAGIPVVDADVLAREAVAPGTAGLQAVVDRFGPAVLAEHGTLDRARLAEIVFRDETARRDLEAIVHPRVRAAIDRFWSDRAPGTRFAVADVPLLYETGREGAFDVVVVAACPREQQVERVMHRDGLSREQAERRLGAQLPIEEKARRADYVIDTSGSFLDTDAAVDGLVRTLAARAARG
jgi:dephospho-CoA kinase